ncbi:hypothetical protein EH223_00890 [candidate division KSB1 bacterium]|nr:hypothetical protein [candidate division KSB1 bacterium]RQW07208.1 MAG: hypothetical protein EH223_00890 [candidate division KSB1 bacterium]
MIDVVFKLENSNGIYFSPDPLPVTIALLNYSTGNSDFNLVFTLVNDRVDSVRTFEITKANIFIESNEKITKTLKFSPPRPGFYCVSCTINDRLIRSMLFGYDPEKTETRLTRERDFNEFWFQHNRDLAAVQPGYKMIKSDQSTAELDVYLVELMCLDICRSCGRVWSGQMLRRLTFAKVNRFLSYCDTFRWP